MTAFGEKRDAQVARSSSLASNERVGVLAHEIRNLLNTAMLAQSALKTGGVGVHGATGAILDRSLIGLRHLVDRSLGEVRTDGSGTLLPARIALADFVAEVRVSGLLEAQSRQIRFRVAQVGADVEIVADRDSLHAAVGNLLQNAFKFSPAGTEVCLDAGASGDHAFIEVHDHCGGLPHDFERRMFEPFSQGNADRTGVGLGLTIARRAVEAADGKLGVRDIPGKGCVFRITLPRASPAETPKVDVRCRTDGEPAQG